MRGATAVFGDEAKAEPVTATVDVKTLHAKIGELTLEHFQEKWMPVFRSEMRENKRSECFRDSEKNGNALENDFYPVRSAQPDC